MYLTILQQHTAKTMHKRPASRTPETAPTAAPIAGLPSVKMPYTGSVIKK